MASLNYGFLDVDFHHFRTNLQSEFLTFVLMEKNLNKMAALAKTESKQTDDVLTLNAVGGDYFCSPETQAQLFCWAECQS